MNKLKKFLIALLILIFIFALSIVYTYDNTKINNVSVHSVIFEQDGFTLDAEIQVSNKGILPMKFKEIDYDVYIKDRDQQLGRGKIPGRWIMPGKITELELEQKIFWQRSLELVLELLNKGNTKGIIDGEIILLQLGSNDFSLDFSQEFELEQYLKQYIKEIVGEYIDNPESIFQIVEEISSQLKGLFGNS